METKDCLVFHIPEQLIDEEMRKRIAPFRPEDVLFLFVNPRQKKEEQAIHSEDTDKFVAELTRCILGEET